MQAPQPTGLEDYRPQKFIRQPTKARPSNKADSNVPNELLLEIDHPLGSRLLKLEVHLGETPFEAVRNQWIDHVLAETSAVPDNSGSAEASQIDSNPQEESTEEANSEQSNIALEEAEADRAETPAGVKPRVRSVPTLRERVKHYVNAVGGEVERDEIEWLLDRWEKGSPLLLLSAGRSWQRAEVAPLLALIDSDQDRELSSNEMTTCEERLQYADIDEDGLVTLAEVTRRSPTITKTGHTHGPLLRLVDKSIETEPDLSMRVDFSKDTQTPGMVSLFNSASGTMTVTARDQMLSVDYGSTYLEIVAVETGKQSEQEVTDSPEQVAVGAVVDGYPLWRLVDLDGDDRLTVREQRRLTGLLGDLDTDGDGALAETEIPIAIRLAVGRGPIIHDMLSTPTPARGRAKPQPRQTAPEWFLSMDANRDGDLARQEFAGSGDQFKQLDKDGDGLLSIAEASGLNPAD